MEINGGKITNALHFHMRKTSIKCDFILKNSLSAKIKMN